MRKLTLDLHRHKRIPFWLCVTLAVLTAWTIVDLVRVGYLRSAIERFVSEQLTANHAVIPAPKDDLSGQTSRQLSDIRNNLLTPWEALLDAIAANANANITVRTVQPDAIGGRAEVSGIATDRDEFLHYVERLRADKRLLSAEPLADAPTNIPATPGITFRLRMSWRGGT